MSKKLAQHLNAAYPVVHEGEQVSFDSELWLPRLQSMVERTIQMGFSTEYDIAFIIELMVINKWTFEEPKVFNLLGNSKINKYQKMEMLINLTEGS